MRSVRDSMRVCAFAAPWLLLISLSLAGCGGGSPTLAKIGSHTITVADFEDAARSNGQQYPGGPDSAKSALLDDLVKRALLLEQASRLHLVPDSTLQRVQKQAAERLAVEALMRKLVPADVPVSDAETRELYQQRNNEAHLRLIYTADQAQASEAVQSLARGEPFPQVASHSNIPGVLPRPDGDMDFVQPGTMPDPLDEWVRTAPLHKVMGPAAAPGFGYFVAEVVERRPRQQPPLEQEKQTLTQMIRVRKMRALQQKAYTTLRDQYQIAVAADGPQALFARLQQSNPQIAHGMGAQPLSPTPGPGDSARVLAHYEGADGKSRTYTLADALKDLTDPGAPRMDPNSLPMLRQWIETELVQRALKVEAARRHVAEEPDVVRRAREQVNNELLQRVYSQQVASRIGQPQMADIEAAYQRHASMLTKLDQATLLVTTVRDSTAAFQLARTLGAVGPATGARPEGEPAAAPAGGLRKAAAGIPGATVSQKVVRYPTQDQFWMFQQANLMGTRPGDSRGPFRSGQGWMIYQLESKQQAQQTLEQLDPQYRHALEAEAAEVERDRVLGRYTDSLRTALGVKLFPDRLKRIPWPVPPKA